MRRTSRGIGHDKHIYVRYLSTSAIEQKTKVATAAGVPPDVSGLYNQDIPQFASMDALEPLDAMAASHGIVSATYKKVFWNECCFQGNLYGLVSSAFDLGLYYNKELFQQRAAQLRRAWVTQRGTSFCIARGAVNSAACFRTAREQKGLEVTGIA